MIVELLAKLPKTIEVYGYCFEMRIYYEYSLNTWVVAYIPIQVTRKLAYKKKAFLGGRWLDKNAKISTNGSKWLIAKPIYEHYCNSCFEEALRSLTRDFNNLIE